MNRQCPHYNWGGDGSEARPVYPREYGARCEYFGIFFAEIDGETWPSCEKCWRSETNEEDRG